ncbi:hypothetical protein EV383_6243 [Pseudonocardia sediminis]|uniref:Uncharacterized protein n=1 Tax=Pseudonocardia sediminis TaxID=1397368 RepID=A0A4V6ME01_PSEST|nr:hypothetical protein [Pseudonocardia sediminis]RZT75502.1 hypothetical protein EV383_6243 [Pseudonocardia sediminis]
MSSLQGYVTASYAALVREFGEPGAPQDPDKSHVEWHLVSPYVGTVTIYDYGPLHECDEHWYISLTEPVEWHVGGRDRAATDWVASRLWVDPHYPAHAGCCGPERLPWWIEERREAEREIAEDSKTGPADAAPDGAVPDEPDNDGDCPSIPAQTDPTTAPETAQIPLIGP